VEHIRGCVSLKFRPLRTTHAVSQVLTGGTPNAGKARSASTWQMRVRRTDKDNKQEERRRGMCEGCEGYICGTTVQCLCE